MKKNTKLIFGVCLAVGLAIAFTGCMTNPIKSNLKTADVNAGNFCVISIDRYKIDKAEINGKRIKSSVPIFSAAVSEAYILPPGHHKIVVGFSGATTSHTYGDARFSSTVAYQQVIEREFENGQFYYILPLMYNGTLTAMVINETDPSVWETQKGSSVFYANERREKVEKKLGIKR